MWKRTKARYGETRHKVAGQPFMSKLEAAVHQLLELREKAGELKIIQAQDQVYLTEARIRCIPDFKCQDLNTGEFFWVEAKGYANDRWPMIKKLWTVYGPGRLEIWMGTYRNPKLTEVITPKHSAR